MKLTRGYLRHLARSGQTTIKDIEEKIQYLHMIGFLDVYPDGEAYLGSSVQGYMVLL